MLTGDNGRAAKAIAKRLGIDEVLAEVLPEDKAEEIKRLKKQGKTLFFQLTFLLDKISIFLSNSSIAV